MKAAKEPLANKCDHFETIKIVAKEYTLEWVHLESGLSYFI